MPKEKPFKLDQVSIRMVMDPPLYSDVPLTTPEAAIKVLQDVFKDYDREVVCLVNLKNNMQPINLNIVSIGVIDQAIIHPRELLKSSILSNASSVLIAHNHPSGNLAPSALDISMTDRLQQVFTLMGIDLVDHIIIGNSSNYYSFREQQEMPVGQPHYTEELAEIRLKEQFPLRPEPTSVLEQLHNAKEENRSATENPAEKTTKKSIRKTTGRDDPGR